MEKINMSKVESSFISLGLNKHILHALSDLGYVRPFFIQEKCIPSLLSGYDVLGLARTGSGKTAAFVLPLLHNINPSLLIPQLLILAPTRELAMQLSEVCVSFSKYIHGINIVSLYGGQNYEMQFRALNRGPQIVVGTPGRLLDHLNRGTLILSKLRSVVIDEADEMLRMGFIQDVRSIIFKMPKDRQIALFSATLPKEIRRVARYFMNNPKEIYLDEDMVVSSNIKQSYFVFSNFYKKEALMRFLEVENFDAAIVFVRTKDATLEISNILKDNGYNSSALNGDMNQIIRQKTLERLKNGQLDILIATDVAARGLDLDRVTLIVNYDAPMNFESYIHRIGRTGRAGRFGRSILFVKDSEYSLLRYIKKSINLNISRVRVPSLEILVQSRLGKFVKKIKKELVDSIDLGEYRSLLSKIQLEENLDIENLAAILLKMAQGKRSLIISSDIKQSFRTLGHKENAKVNCDSFLSPRKKRRKFISVLKNDTKKNNVDLYRINIGKDDGVKVHHIIGAIFNKGDVKNHKRYIGHIKLFASYSIIEISQSIPDSFFLHFSNMRILNKSMNIKFLGTASTRRKIRFRKSALNK